MRFCSNNHFFFSAENTGVPHQQPLMETSHVLLIIACSAQGKREGFTAPNLVEAWPKVKYPPVPARGKPQLCWVAGCERRDFIGTDKIFY